MKCCSRVALLVLGFIFTCCMCSNAYETNISLQNKLKTQIENSLSSAYNPEIDFPSINEEKLFYSAMKGSADDQFKVGLLFGRGKEVKRDFLKCIALFEKAADMGHIDASFLLGTIYLKGGSIFEELKTDVEYAGIIIPGEYPYDISRAFHYYLISGNKGDKLSYDVCFLLKIQHLNNKANPVNAGKILKSLEVSAENGNALAQRFLAELYSEGNLVEQDDYKAFDLFKESAEGGDVWGEYNIARKYISGLGVERDTVKGYIWMKKAAEQNLTAAQFDLAVLYYLGTGTDINRQMGYAWLLVAKANGHPEAETLVNEADNGGLTPEEEKEAHEIAAKLLAQMSDKKNSKKLAAALSKS